MKARAFLSAQARLREAGRPCRPENAESGGRASSAGRGRDPQEGGSELESHGFLRLLSQNVSVACLSACDSCKTEAARGAFRPVFHREE